MSTLALIGAGDLGQQIKHFALSDGHYDRVVFFDDFYEESSKVDIEVIGGTDTVEKCYKDGVFDELIIAIGYKHMAKKVAFYDTWKGKIPFGKIVHSSCIVDETAKVKEGVVIYPGCILDISVEVRANTLINVGNSISHHTTIGEHCFLSPRSAFAGFIEINEKCIIGINSTIIDNIKICKQTQLGGGTVVIKDINKSGLYVGNPARFVR